MVKDEIDLMMELEWLVIQDELLTHRAKAIEKEIKVIEKYRKIRETELELVKSKKKKK